MPNHLSGETSPYLLQHADNPVDWYPWGAEALEKAQAEDKPIFLSIGYAACHWCHVMAHESFEDERVAAILNAHFVNIKVDREERPDLDRIYMSAVQAITGRGGWPLSVFLTPDGHPFFGGTYFPPVARYGMPSFADVLLTVADAWRNRRQELVEGSRQLVQAIERQMTIGGRAEKLRAETLTVAIDGIAGSFDPRFGGWGDAPKFPQPMTLEFLLRRHHATGDDHETPVIRPRETQDNAVPSGNGMAATVLLLMAGLAVEPRYEEIALEMLARMQPLLARYPLGFGQWLIALDYALSRPAEIAIVGDPEGADTRALLVACAEGYRPHQVIAVGLGDEVPLLRGRNPVDGRAAAYVCRDRVCLPPVTEPEALAI